MVGATDNKRNKLRGCEDRRKRSFLGNFFASRGCIDTPHEVYKWMMLRKFLSRSERSKICKTRDDASAVSRKSMAGHMLVLMVAKS